MVIHMNHARRSHALAATPTPAPLDDDLRRRLEALVETAIDLLDAIDAAAGDGDDEPDDVAEDGSDLEPSLGAPEPTADRMDQRQWARGCDTDRELAAETPRRPRRAQAAPAEPVSPALIELVPGMTITFQDPETRVFVDRAGRQYAIPPDEELAPLLPGERLLIGQHGDQYRLAARTPFAAVEIAR